MAAGRVTRILDHLVAQADDLAQLVAASGGDTDEAFRLRDALTMRRGAATAQIRQVGDVLVGLVLLARRAGVPVPPASFEAAVRHLATQLADDHPGQSIEVRVPPIAAVQIGSTAGPTHTRGTPPNVVETDAGTWFELAVGLTGWADALADGRVRASGAHAHELAAMLPVASGKPA
ncbi:MAG: sterol carrier family protein [Propionibacterium sp.]|nr:sterol carrier family protein [Propionibacterium sp.]